MERDGATEQFIEALLADGHPSLRNFRKLVGSWHVTGTRLDDASGEWMPREFDYLVSWVLEGRAIQDLEVVTLPDGTRRTVAIGLRVADPQAGIARVSFFAPDANEYTSMIASTWRGGVRQDGSQNDGRPIRWNFTDIREDGYDWQGWVSDDEGATWRLVEELRGARTA